MKKRMPLVLCFTSLLLFYGSDADAAWSARVKKDKLIIVEGIPSLSVEEHYSRAANFYNERQWDKAAKEFKLVADNFEKTSYGQDANYFLAISYYNMCELDLANEAFNKYLQCQSNPQYFKESLDYKFAIAERLQRGERKRYFGAKQMPKWALGYDLALEIYEEIIATVPNSSMAELSLYGKGTILKKIKDFRGSVDAFQTLINRFPKSELAVESFLQINNVYLEQCQREFQNPDLLAFSEINVKRFEEQFPGEERLDLAKKQILSIKEVFAKGMYETAYFYERLNHPGAAAIYYQKAITDFPETCVAKLCKERLSEFCPRALKEIEELRGK